MVLQQNQLCSNRRTSRFCSCKLGTCFAGFAKTTCNVKASIQSLLLCSCIFATRFAGFLPKRPVKSKPLLKVYSLFFFLQRQVLMLPPPTREVVYFGFVVVVCFVFNTLLIHCWQFGSPYLWVRLQQPQEQR